MTIPVEDKMPWNSNLQSSNLALIVAVKWGTVWTLISTGTEIAKGQIWMHVFYQVNMKVLTLTFCNTYAIWDRSSYSTYLISKLQSMPN